MVPLQGWDGTPGQEAIRAWGRGWRDPATRQARIARRRRSHELALTEGAKLTRAGEALAVRGTLALRLRLLGRHRRRVLDAMLDCGLKTSGEIAERVPCARRLVVRCLRDPGFMQLLRDITETAFPGKAAQLQGQIIRDALTPAGDSTDQRALVEHRKQAAAFLGLTLSTPEVQEHRGQVSHVHALASKAPREALEAWSASGTWDEDKYGPPPWKPDR